MLPLRKRNSDLKLILRSLALLAFVTLLAGCAVNPVTGEQQFSLVSPQQEVAIGAKQYLPAQQSQGGRYYIDPGVQTYINEVGQKLARVSDRSQLPYEFVVLNNSVPNAWALPGGKIAVNRGLLILLEDESQLAAVLAHEIVHAAARHSASQMTRGMLAGIGLQVLGAASGQNELGGLAAQLGTSAWMAHYGRSAELESDAYGMDYMVRAGYDPFGAVKLQEKFVELARGKQQDFMSALFASHPPSQERVTANLAKARTYPASGLQNREHFAKQISRIKHDQPAYEAQNNAMKALLEKAPRKALNHLDEAISLQPREGQFWELRGHAWKMLGKQSKATQAFSTAISKNPDYFSHHLALGIQNFEQNKMVAAERDLIKSRQLLPTPISSLYLGDIAAAKGDNQAAITYYREAAATVGEVGRQAKDKLASLEIAAAPNHYISTGLTITEDGYLQLHMHNKSANDVSGMVVQISEFIGSSVTGPASYIEVKGILKGGQQRVLRTRIGPLQDTNAANRYRSLVIKARTTGL
ncbi:MAG: peptidase M48 [Gammaproteobacteria bacterium]|nr:MAG: peptidase M48 [Gammaproteobacteria bacterium]